MKLYRVTVFPTADGWRWQMIPANGGKIVDASTESFSRRGAAKRNAGSATGARGFQKAGRSLIAYVKR